MTTFTLPAFLRNPRITGMVRTADVPTNYFLDRWFPEDSVEEDEFESVIVHDQVNLAPFVAVDAETPIAPDDIYGKMRWEVAYMRFKKRYKESDLRVFFEPGVSDPNTLAAVNARKAESKIRRGVDEMSQSIDARKEWIMANAISGSVAYDDTHVQYTVTYGGPFIGTNRRTPGGGTWSSASPTIVADLTNWLFQVSDVANHDRWIALTSRHVLRHMAQNQGIRELWSNSTRNPAAADPDSLDVIAPGMVRGALSLIGIEGLVIYDAKYTTYTSGANTATRTIVDLLDNRDFFLLPADMPLGRFATAPAAPNNYRTGKFGWSKVMTDPWVTEVGAGYYGWIDFSEPMQRKLLQARVL